MTHDGRVERRIPLLAWALVAAAGVQLVIWASGNWYRVFGPYLILRLEDLSVIVTGVAPFLLAAAVLVGAPRWPAGRLWLYSGAALVAFHGVMQTAGDAWWAWRMSDPVASEGALQVVLIVVNMLAVAAFALAPLCLAAGLARVESVRRASPLAIGLIVTVGMAAAAAGLGLGAREIAWTLELQSGEAAFLALNVAYRLLITLGAVALAVLGVAAVRALPRPGVGPEVLIAIGATVAAAGLAASWAAQAILSIETQSAQQTWVFTVPWVVESIGKVLLIVGFGIAGLSPRRARSFDAPRASSETVAG